MNNQRELLLNKLEGEGRYLRVCTDLYMDTRMHMCPPTQMNTFIHTYIKAWVERRNTRGERNERKDGRQAGDNTGCPGES